MKKKAIAVFISGRGSNLKSIIKACSDNDFPGYVSIVISDNKYAEGLKHAKQNNIDHKIFELNKFDSSELFDNAIINDLSEREIDLICLAGYMRILSKEFINNFQNNILNIHPSLLPKFKGLNTHKRAIESRETKSGCTVHYVNEELDGGKIIEQKEVAILRNDTPKSLSEKILKIEHKLYPEVIKKVLTI
jgi:phosphoribosylglycinamide formyltransferase-1